MDDTLIFFGDTVKALGGGRVGGHVVLFSTDADPDLAGDFFTKATDFFLEEDSKAPIFYNHGLDPKLKARKLGRGSLKVDEVGVWIEGQLDLRDEYEKAVYAMAEAGKLGWSSGSAGHLVAREKIKKSVEIKSWPIVEASLTPVPTEPRTSAVTLKSLQAEINADMKGIFEASLADRQFAVWQLWEVFGSSMRALAVAARVVNVTGITVDVPAKVEEAVSELAARLAPSVTKQIQEFLQSNNGERDFYLKSLPTDINSLIEGDAPAALPFIDHSEAVLAAARGVATRAKSIQELRIKSGRVLSATNRSRLGALMTQLTDVAADIKGLLDDTEMKPAEKSVDPAVIANLLAQFEQHKFARLRA